MLTAERWNNFRHLVWLAPDEVHLRRGEPMLALATLSRTIPTGSDVFVSAWGRHRVKDELLLRVKDNMKLAYPEWATMSLVPLEGTPQQTLVNVVDAVIVDCLEPMLQPDGTYNVPKVRGVSATGASSG